MFIDIYAGDLAIRKLCYFDRPLNNILKSMDGCLHIFCLVNIKSHRIRMLEMQPSLFYTDPLYQL